MALGGTEGGDIISRADAPHVKIVRRDVTTDWGRVDCFGFAEDDLDLAEPADLGDPAAAFFDLDFFLTTLILPVTPGPPVEAPQ